MLNCPGNFGISAICDWQPGWFGVRGAAAIPIPWEQGRLLQPPQDTGILPELPIRGVWGSESDLGCPPRGSPVLGCRNESPAGCGEQGMHFWTGRPVMERSSGDEGLHQVARPEHGSRRAERLPKPCRSKSWDGWGQTHPKDILSPLGEGWDCSPLEGSPRPEVEGSTQSSCSPWIVPRHPGVQQFLLGKTLSAKQSMFSTQKSDTPLP